MTGAGTLAIERSLWPAERLGDAIVQLARAVGLPMRDAVVGKVPPAIACDRAALGAWLSAAAQALRLETDELRVEVREVEATLLGASPAIIALGRGEAARFAAIVRSHRDAVVLLAPDGTHARASVRALTEAIRGEVDAEASARVEGLLERGAVKAAKRARARGALLEHLVGDRLIDLGWALALPPSAPFAAQLRDAGVFSSAGTMMLMQLAQQALLIAGFWLVGRGALEGQIERGWLVAWALVLFSAIPPRAVATWAQGSAALRFSILLKRRLLSGALRLGPEEVRAEGSGEMLGRVIESEAVESLVTSGGLATILALVEVVVAAVVIALAPGGAATTVAFLAVLGIGAALTLAVDARTVAWTHARLEMTQDLVERMIGHRTRLAQEPRERWHDAEDGQLARYSALSVSLDRVNAWMQGALPRAWLVVGIAVTAPSFVGGAASGAGLAVAIGGLMLGSRAIAHVTAGIGSLLRARVAWDKTRPLFEAGAREERLGSPTWGATSASERGGAVVEARDLHFRYGTRHEPVLRGVSVKIAPRDRLLLEGPSGGGKSTLGAVLTGLRAPDAGLLLLGGLDPQTLGETGWRRRVVGAPQFHENHLISATLGFNLLMGRGWPPRPEDLREALEVCIELGLGPLLERMPSGLMQMVGETGWQLSHGERSRVFMARALLQRADVMVLDESFAALDPETLERALGCVLRRAPALVVIAHP
jgi:ATP-binding cassette, subfamily B, bacterial